MITINVKQPRVVDSESTQLIAEKIESVIEKSLTTSEYYQLRGRLAEHHQRFYLQLTNQEVCIVCK